MMLVGKFGPDTLTVDERAALDLQQVAAQPLLRDELADLWIARVEPVSREIEREPVDDFGPRQSADAILRFEHRESVLELASTREPRKTTASDHDVGERHRGTHLLRHRLGCPSK